MKDKDKIPVKQQHLVQLALGSKIPQSPQEEKIQKEIEQIRKEGKIVEIPKEFI